MADLDEITQLYRMIIVVRACILTFSACQCIVCEFCRQNSTKY